MNSVSFSTIFGILIGFGLFITAVVLSTNNYVMFLSLQSILMVIGGTVAATMISYDGRYVLRAFASLFSIFIPTKVSPKQLLDDVSNIIRWSQGFRKNRQQGDTLENLEGQFRRMDIDSPFLQHCVRTLVDGYNGPELKRILENHLHSIFERKMVQVRIINAMASIAPAFGMVGTVVGLMVMLDNLGGDLTKLGHGMALALLTTLYGLLLSQLVFKPAARKLQQKYEMERFRNRLVSSGFVMMAEMKPSWEIQGYLNSYLDQSSQLSVASRY